MLYIYHRIPKEMRGNILFPLNILKEKYPEVYEKQVHKYAGRENIMNYHIPILNCLWNDVLHFSAVHPALLKEALIEAGATDLTTFEFFEIDPQLLDPEKTVLFSYRETFGKGGLKESDFSKYDPDDVARYSVLPPDTKEYYKARYAEGKNPLLFHKVPHILFKGELDTSSFKRISI